MNRRILNLALPNIITNITVPLLGMVDLAIVGHIGGTVYIGAIAIGTMIFNMVYWIFGFLRMGTSGFTAQAYGADDIQESAKILTRSLFVGIAIAFVLLIAQLGIIDLAMRVVEGSQEMKAIAERYFFVNIWGAPAVLSMYSLKGWFIGMQNSKIPMFISIAINVINILLSLLFVFVFNMDIEGIALGTVIAQYCGLLLAVVFLLTKYDYVRKIMSVKDSIVLDDMKNFFKVNYDIFLRTVCLVAVFSFFPIAGSYFGDEVLAVNTLLMQFFVIFSYIMDGFAYAGEALTGRFIGAKDRHSLIKSIKMILYWGVALTILFTIVYALWGNNLLYLFTDEIEIINYAAEFYWWVLFIPIAGFSAFLFDGIFIGATASRYMLYAILIATAIFFAIYFGFSGMMGNNALWMALILFLTIRGVGQGFLVKKAVLSKV